jgi:hypothetical protein
MAGSRSGQRKLCRRVRDWSAHCADWVHPGQPVLLGDLRGEHPLMAEGVAAKAAITFRGKLTCVPDKGKRLPMFREPLLLGLSGLLLVASASFY